MTRTHETDETQSISCAAASRAFLRRCRTKNRHVHRQLSMNVTVLRSGPTATCLVAVKGQVAKLFEHVSTHLTHFNTTHLPKESVNFRAKGAFMIAVSYKIMLYLYPPTYSKLLRFHTPTINGNPSLRIREKHAKNTNKSLNQKAKKNGSSPLSIKPAASRDPHKSHGGLVRPGHVHNFSDSSLLQKCPKNRRVGLPSR